MEHITPCVVKFAFGWKHGTDCNVGLPMHHVSSDAHWSLVIAAETCPNRKVRRTTRANVDL